MAPKRVVSHGGCAPRVLKSAVAERRKKERRTDQPCTDIIPPWRTADRLPAKKKSAANVDPAELMKNDMKNDTSALTKVEAEWLNSRQKIKNMQNEVDRRKRRGKGKGTNDRGSRDQQIRGSGGSSGAHSASLVTLKGPQ